eukprot:TRINITY_DN31850_c1_g1_i1.p4 TRINITY_DN31850_c1_g1~~TRINITY_DN31850_c1_g1_i1.p4  ORF type:complete len:102 (+),score=19.95 TRINITY_DN31850_c1_g1_i1:416-721(+)
MAEFQQAKIPKRQKIQNADVRNTETFFQGSENSPSNLVFFNQKDPFVGWFQRILPPNPVFLIERILFGGDFQRFPQQIWYFYQKDTFWGESEIRPNKFSAF